MEQGKDIRWRQHFSSFHKACQRLNEVTESGVGFEGMSGLERDGLVRRFVCAFELAWNVLQDLLTYKGYEFVSGPNGSLRTAFADGLITDHDGWWQMVKARNTLSHVYAEDEAEAIIRLIFSRYALLLKNLDVKLGELAQNNDYLNL